MIKGESFEEMIARAAVILASEIVRGAGEKIVREHPCCAGSLMGAATALDDAMFKIAAKAIRIAEEARRLRDDKEKKT